jgi:hypothetical protein
MIAQIKEVHGTERSGVMNEVNVHVTQPAIRGLFTVDKPRAKLDALSAQHHYKATQGVELPMFLYDPRKGALETWTVQPGEPEQLLESVRPGLSRDSYSQVIAS